MQTTLVHDIWTKYPEKPEHEQHVRESYFLFVEGKGAIEVWRDPTNSFPFPLGGVEIHSKTPIYDGNEPLEGCRVLGGQCYTDGSSLAFDEFQPFFDNPQVIRAKLEEWAQLRFAEEGDPHE